MTATVTATRMEIDVQFGILWTSKPVQLKENNTRRTPVHTESSNYEMERWTYQIKASGLGSTVMKLQRTRKPDPVVEYRDPRHRTGECLNDCMNKKCGTCPR